ncbi:unnamed protein product [Mytilus coruscus]|uniref:Chromo domain-containing protein n=1 Tax=Mytilus coruscus TaxID=42192 RepID=A0A6J8B8X5_MYTCO|nr:unnamed protein product [Mytilus coruscus]
MPNTRKRKIDFKRLPTETFFGTVTETVETRAVLPDTYDVERIIACRKLKRCEEYLVKWVGFSFYECTWEPADLPACLIPEFREPTQPLPQNLLQDVSDNILAAFQDRLHRRTGLHFCIEIKHNIFRNISKAKPDCLYMKSDFDNLLFPNGWDVVFYSNQGKALNNYIENLQSPLVNKGKTIPECKSRKQSNTEISIKQWVNKALWFAKSFGVDLQELKVVDSAGSTHDLLKNTKPVGRYEQVPETEQDKVKSLLYILDKFGVSDDAYHELAVYNDGLPRSYLIKQCRQDINDMCTITQTPGISSGSQLTLKETLDILLTRHNIEGLELPVIQIKFAADGAKMYRMSNFFVLSLAVLNSGEEVISVSGQHTLTIVDRKKDFISI